MGSEPVKVKLSVWKDFAPTRALLLRDDASLEHRVLSLESNLQQEVYVWQTREDPFAGVADDAARERLREKLIDWFAAAKPPAERRFARLNDFIEEAQLVLESGGAEWTVSQDATDDEEQPVRLNTLLSLRNHLDWLRRVFAEQPGISVLVR